MMRSKILGSTAMLALLATPGLAQTSAQQNGASAGVETIVVTAEKRSEAIQSVPMAITAFSNADLTASGITDFRDYAVQVPNLAFSYSGNLFAQAQAIAIRGVFGSNTTGMYIDDTPLPESLDPRVLDIHDIEILKGPQGTLYGARSMGGTVRLLTNQPDTAETSGYLHSVGSYTDNASGNASVDGTINVPLIDNVLAIRVNAYDDFESGFITRSPSASAPVVFDPQKGVGAAHFDGGSISAVADLLNDKLIITPRYMYEVAAENGHPYADYTASNLDNQRDFNLAEPGTSVWALSSLTVKYELPFGEVTSDTSAFNRRSADSEDDTEVASLFFGLPPIPVQFHVTDRYNALSEEDRFTSSFGGPFEFTGGIFYQKTYDTRIFPDTNYPGVTDNLYSEQDINKISELAVFGQGTYDVTSALRFIAGARWFHNVVAFSSAEQGLGVYPFQNPVTKQEQYGVDPRLGVQYKLDQDDMIYVSAAKGFRVGGVNTYSNSLCAGNLASLGLTPTDVNTYRSDSLWSYEVGAKTGWLDNRLNVNADLFDIEWNNVQQVLALQQCGFGVNVNSGAARSQGGEVEVSAAVLDNLKISAGGGYTDARIVSSGAHDVVPVGTPIEQVPQWTFNTTGDYRFETLRIPSFVRATFSYVDSSISANNGYLVRPSYTLTNLRAGIDISSVEVTAFVDNLFDEHANLADPTPQGIVLPGRPRIVTSQPRTIGLDARVTF